MTREVAVLVLTALLGVAGFSLIRAQTVIAHDHVPPRVSIKVAGGTQKGSPYSTEWIHPTQTPGICVEAVADGVLGFDGKALKVPRGQRVAKLTFLKVQRPISLEVSQWESVDSTGKPKGDSRRLDYRLSKRDGRVARWVARVPIAVTRDRYLDVFVRWRDDEGCGGVQSAAWAFEISPS